jgi:MFS family permease
VRRNPDVTTPSAAPKERAQALRAGTALTGEGKGYAVLAFVSASYFLCYLDRMVMASAAPFIAKDLALTDVQLGTLLSAFFVGYTVMQVPGGILVDRYGARRVLMASLVLWSVFTGLTGVAMTFVALVLVRVLFGLGEGPFPSSAGKALALSFSRNRVGLANGIQFSATSVGAAVAPLLTVAIVSHFGWRYTFLALVVPGFMLALSAPWFIPRAIETPSPRGAGAIAAATSRMEAVKSLFHIRGLIWAAAALFLLNVVSWGLMNWLPSYLLQVRGIEKSGMAAIAGAANIAGAFGYPIGGYLGDKFRQQRQWVIAGGLLVSAALSFLIAGVTGGNTTMVLCLFLLFLLINAIAAILFAVPLSIKENVMIGRAFGFVNTAGQLAGIVSPAAIGYILSITSGNYQTVFLLLCAVTLVAVVPAMFIAND